MAGPLVAVDEGVIRNDRKAERRRLVCNGRVEIVARESHARLRHGREESTEVADGGLPPDCFMTLR